jgi:hypothetical protein
MSDMDIYLIVFIVILVLFRLFLELIDPSEKKNARQEEAQTIMRGVIADKKKANDEAIDALMGYYQNDWEQKKKREMDRARKIFESQHCSYCKSKTKESADYCTQCGAPID